MKERLYTRSPSGSTMHSVHGDTSRLQSMQLGESDRGYGESRNHSKPIIRLPDGEDLVSPVDSSTYLTAQSLRPPESDDGTSNAPPPSMGGLELANNGQSPYDVDDSNDTSDLSVGTLGSGGSRGLDTFRAALDVFDGIRTSTVSIDDSAMMIKRLEKVADHGFKRTYVLGQPVRDIYERAPVLKVGLSFLPGCDRPTVNRLEQTNMIPDKQPDQLDATWRVNTAGHLLNDFEVTNDLSYVTKDRTAEIASKARERLNRQSINPFPATSSYAVIVRNRELDAVTIDSEEVKIVHDLRNHRGEFDLECTLIEVDGPSLLNLIVGYKTLIQRRDPASNLDETKTLLETMMEQVRRLCHRSPILFRMSTRDRIITSRNTRYGINHGREFTTLTTSKGIREIVSLSAAYYSTLDADPKAQKFIRPRYLQMLVLLLSFLNDDDLLEIRPFLESTFKLQAERQHLELLFLKVIPLASINDKLFLTSMVPAFEGWSPREPVKPESGYWDTFITRILPLGYILPGKVSQLGRCPLSWIMKWPKDGFKNSDVFHNLQYEGHMQTFNDIPPIEDLIDREDENNELTVVMTNETKFIIRIQDYEPIICLTEGTYVMQEAQTDGRTRDLIIKEEWLNQASRDAVKMINPVIKNVNAWLMTPRRSNSRLGPFRPKKKMADIKILEECHTSGRITKHRAILGQDTLATAYKLDGRKLFIRDAVSIMAHDILYVESVVKYYEEYMQDQVHGLDGDTYRWIKQQLASVTALIDQAENVRRQLSQDDAISDEPIAKVIQPKGGSPFAPRIWHDYRTYITAGNYLHMEAEKSTVIKVSWLSDKIVEVLLQGGRKKYFASPLEFVDEARREDEVQVGDIAVLAGQYMVLAVPNEEEANDTLIMTNYLRVSSIAMGT